MQTCQTAAPKTAAPAAAATSRDHFVRERLRREPVDRPIAERRVAEVLASPGRPLEPHARALMESRFGHDFSQVRVHSDAKAAESAESVGSLAYTVGQDVVFGPSRYAPHTAQGLRLLAHELTHTIQQSGFAPSAGSPSHSCIVVEPPGTTAEHVADDCSRRLGSRGAIAPIHHVALQRQPVEAAQAPAQTETDDAPLFTMFVADPAKSRDKRFARDQARADAERIRKAGTLSGEDRQLVNAKLRFFTGDAWEAYRQEIRPILVEVTAAEAKPAPTAQEDAAERERRQRQLEYEGMAAYYASTRQSALDSRAAEVASLREEVLRMDPAQIDANWERGKEAFVAVASTPGHQLNKRQLYRIWLKYWAERHATAEARIMDTRRGEAARDRDAFKRKMFNFYEHNERDAFGVEYKAAEDDVAFAELMFRMSVDAMDILIAAEGRGMVLTLEQLSKHVLDLAGWKQAAVEISSAFAMAARMPQRLPTTPPRMPRTSTPPKPPKPAREPATQTGSTSTARDPAPSSSQAVTAGKPPVGRSNAPARAADKPSTAKPTQTDPVKTPRRPSRLGNWIRGKILSAFVRGAEASEVFPSHSPGGSAGSRRPVPTLSSRTTPNPTPNTSGRTAVTSPAPTATASAPTATSTTPSQTATTAARPNQIPSVPRTDVASQSASGNQASPQQAAATAASVSAPHAAGAQVVQVSPEEYAARLGFVTPQQYDDPVLQAVESAGQIAAAILSNPATPAGARFIQACQNRNWALAGTLFHAEAARQLQAIAPMVAGVTITTEDTVQAGRGGSRLDVTAVDASGNHYDIDWKTTGRSAFSSKSRAELQRHATQYQANRGAPLNLQISKSWVDFVRSLIPNIRWPK